MNRHLGFPMFLAPTVLAFAALSGGGQAADFGPKRVLTFYYTWYATEAFSGKNLHYKNVDPAKQDIGSSRHYPLGGAYDSHDPAVLERHMAQMEAAGIDGPITTWWGIGDWNDTALPILLEKAQKHGRVVTAYYETTPGETNLEETAAKRLAHIIQTHTSHPAWLKVNGRPVIFIYVRAVNQIKPASRWATIRKLVIEKTGVDPFLVGDGIRDDLAQVFDGVHQYNTAGRLRGIEDPQDIAHALAEVLLTSVWVPRRQGRLACYTVIPGYDDTKNRKPGLAIPRLDGKTYDIGWEAAIGRDIDWVLVTTFNEWHEGSEIEPSKEFGDYYLKATAKWTQRFKDPQAKSIAFSTNPSWKPFAEKWTGGTLAILGGPRGMGLELELSGLPTRMSTIEEFAQGKVKASDFPIAVYTEGEAFKNQYDNGATFESALRKYWADGGVLVLASYMPWPLFREVDSGETGWTKKIGLNLAIADQGEGKRGFEKTLPEPGLLIRDTKTGATEPFPTKGDLRFRPSLAPRDAKGLDYQAWLTVYGAKDKRYGDALSSYHYKSGPFAPAKMIYVWEGLWSTGDPAKRAQDVLTKAAELAQAGR